MTATEPAAHTPATSAPSSSDAGSVGAASRANDALGAGAEVRPGEGDDVVPPHARDLDPMVAALLLPAITTGFLLSMLATSVLVIPLLIEHTDHAVEWAAARVAMSLGLYVVCRRLRSRLSDAPFVLRRLRWIVFVGAVPWGLLPVVVQPEHLELQGYIVAFVCGNLFTAAAMSAASPCIYRASAIPVAGLSALGVVLTGGHAMPTWLLLLAIGSLYSYLLFGAIHRGLMARFRAEFAQQQLARQRDEQRAEAERANEELEVALRRRSIAAAELSLLLTALGHDLSTPLTSATLAADVLGTSGEGLTDEQRRLVSQIRSSTKHANAVVRNLRQRPSSTSRDLEITRESVDVGELARGVVAELVPPTVRLDTGGLAPGVVARCDCSLVARMLDNLVANALVHGRPTCITLTARHREGLVELIVADDGIGVPEHLHDELFDPHTRGDESRGDGVGLFLVRTLARLQDGDVDFVGDSNGSRFTITLPASG